MQTSTWIHILLLVGSLVGFGIVSWALYRQKIAEHNKHTTPTGSDQAMAFALGLGWWAAFCVAYLIAWHSWSDVNVSSRFGFIVLLMLVCFAGFPGLSVLIEKLAISDNVYTIYGFSFGGPFVIVALIAIVVGPVLSIISASKKS